MGGGGVHTCAPCAGRSLLPPLTAGANTGGAGRSRRPPDARSPADSSCIVRLVSPPPVAAAVVTAAGASHLREGRRAGGPMRHCFSSSDSSPLLPRRGRGRGPVVVRGRPAARAGPALTVPADRPRRPKSVTFADQVPARPRGKWRSRHSDV